MATYHDWTPLEPAATQAPPKSGWERLAEAQDEAKRNAQVAPLHYHQASRQPIAPARSVQYALVASQAPEPKPEPEVGPFGYYFYYPVSCHFTHHLCEHHADNLQQPVYMAAEPMHYAPAANHAAFYQAAAPAPAPKPEEPKSEPAPSPFGDPNTEFYCRELDGSWSLRTCTDIVTNCQPGFWQTNAKSGWPVYYRQT
ncbi:MAG: hypothetical protein Q9191_000964 [Dirinaria sp. TL-2023a]